MVEVGAGAGQQLVGELVIGHVGGDGVLNPFAKRRRSFGAEELAVDLQQIGPAVRPLFDVIGIADQLVDHLIALDLGGARVLQELADGFGFGRQAGQIEMDPANEVAVAAHIARLNLELLELVVDQAVDPVEFGHVLPDKAGAVAHDDERCAPRSCLRSGPGRRFRRGARR